MENYIYLSKRDEYESSNYVLNINYSNDRQTNEDMLKEHKVAA